MIRALLLGSAVLALGAPALAAPVVFTDRAAFEAAVDALGPTTQGFESFESLDFGATFTGRDGPPLDGLTITSPVQFVVRPSLPVPDFRNPATDGVKALGSTFGLAGTRTLTFTFDMSVNAFGLDLIGVDTRGAGQEILLDAFGETFTVVPNGLNQGSTESLFFGIVNDMGTETTFAFTRPNSSNFVTFDAVATAAVSDVAVPAPAAVALFGLGALALGLARRARG